MKIKRKNVYVREDCLSITDKGIGITIESKGMSAISVSVMVGGKEVWYEISPVELAAMLIANQK